MKKFDYAAAAELFSPNSGGKLRIIGYKRFARAADAIQFAIERRPSDLILGTSLLIGDERYGGQQIRALYDSDDYPLRRSP
jgi:hypothetical protein